MVVDSTATIMAIGLARAEQAHNRWPHSLSPGWFFAWDCQCTTANNWELLQTSVEQVVFSVTVEVKRSFACRGKIDGKGLGLIVGFCSRLNPHS